MFRRVLVVFGLISLTVFGVAGVARATQGEDHKVTLCHRTDSYKNPYVSVTVDVASVQGIKKLEGHGSEHMGPVFFPAIPKHTEWGDIIPAVTYEKNGTTVNYPGQNLTPGGLAILANDCKLPPPPTTTTAPTTTAPTTSTTVVPPPPPPTTTTTAPTTTTTAPVTTTTAPVQTTTTAPQSTTTAAPGTTTTTVVVTAIAPTTTKAVPAAAVTNLPVTGISSVWAWIAAGLIVLGGIILYTGRRQS